LLELLFSDDDHFVGGRRRWDPVYNLGRWTGSGSKGLGRARRSAFFVFCTTGML
jgi:hypothetical protein